MKTTVQIHQETISAQSKGIATLAATPTLFDDRVEKILRAAKVCVLWAVRFARALNTLLGLWDRFWRRACPS